MNNTIEKYFISILRKWFPFIWILLSLLIFMLIYFYTKEIKVFNFDFSSRGWIYFVEIFKVPLSFFVVGIPIYGIIVTLYRSVQFEENMRQLQKQGFDNTFFNFLKIQQDIVNAFDLIPGGPKSNVIKGRDCFKTFYNRYIDYYKNNDEAKKHQDLNRIQISFSKYYKHTQSDLAHYYNHLINMILFVDRSRYRNKKFYIHIIKSQFSSYELLLLFYFGLSNLNENIKLLIEKYALLENYSVDQLIESTHVEYYRKTAFDKSIFILKQ